MPTMKSLGIDRMSAEERLALAQEILDSLADADLSPPLTEAERDELDRRAAAHGENPGEAIPWEVIRDEARARLGL